MSLIHPSFLKRVVALGVPNPSSKDSIQFVATGFLYGYFAGKNERGKGEYYPFLVTNRHVIEGKTDLIVRLNGREEPVHWHPSSWCTHPDPEIDVAVAPFNLEEFQGVVP